MKINVTKPEGNIFAIMGVFNRLAKDLREEGFDVSEYVNLKRRMLDMKYDDILNEIERITNGSITFTHRKSP